MASHRRNPARFGGKMRNFGGIWRKTVQFGEKGRNILQIKKLRNVAKFKKNDKIKRNLSMKWRNVAEYGRISAKFSEIWRATGEIQRDSGKKGEILRNVAKSGEIWRKVVIFWRKVTKNGEI